MNYELMLVLKPLLPEDLKSKVLGKIEKKITSLKGEIVDQDVWGKKHLAYPIKKHEEGYYILYQISLPPESSEEFQTELRLTNDVLRYLMLKESEK